MTIYCSFCEVGIRATYLDELPFELYEMTEVDYDRLMKKGQDNG